MSAISDVESSCQPSPESHSSNAAHLIWLLLRRQDALADAIQLRLKGDHCLVRVVSGRGRSTFREHEQDIVHAPASVCDVMTGREARQGSPASAPIRQPARLPLSTVET